MTGYEIDEIYNESIMTGIPAVIVEGVTDLEVYALIAGHLEFDLEIFAVENIEGFAEGSIHVIAAIEELYSLPAISSPVSSHVLGIIDKDVRDFRNELPTSEALFILKYYSIESHFITKDIVRYIAMTCTKGTSDLISEQVLDLIQSEIEENLSKLYYLSLESLKCALEPGYAADFQYSYASGRTKNEVEIEKVLAKKADLDLFADSKGISLSIETLKVISRGKWLIYQFSISVAKSLKNLHASCGKHNIEKCKFCRTGSPEKCLLKIKDGFNRNTIESLALCRVDPNECGYIIERFEALCA